MDGNHLAEAVAIGDGLGLGLNLGGILTPLPDIPRARILHLLHGLRDAGADIRSIGQRVDLQEYFFTIIEHAAHEANRGKIDRWKNAIIHLAMDFQDNPFKDNLIRTLADLTEFDLTVLSMIYGTTFDRKRDLGNKVRDYFEHCDVGRPITSQAIKRLASHALLDEQGSSSRLAASGSFSYAPNDLGLTLLRFISTDYSVVAGESEVPQSQYAPD